MWLPIIILFLVSFVLGVHSSSRVKGKVRNFFVAGNIIPSWVLVCSMTGQAIELGATKDNAGLAMTGAFWAGAVLPIGVGLSLVLLGLFFAKPLNSMRLLTLPDYYIKRYDGKVGVLVSIITIASFIILTAGNLAGIGLILQAVLHIPLATSIIAVALIIMLYTIAGGLFAVTWNDVLQVGVILVGIIAAFCWIFAPSNEQYSLSRAFSEIDLKSITSIEDGALNLWASLLALAVGDIVALDFMERVFAAKTPSSARFSCLFAGVMTIVIGLVMALIGLAATQGSTALDQSDPFMSWIQTALPPGVAMLMLMGLIAAGISTCDGAIFACAKVASKNLAMPLAKSIIKDETLLLTTRLCTIPITIISVALAIIRPIPGDLLILAFDVVFAGCFIPLALGIYWSKGNAKAALWSIIIPSLLRVVLHFVFADLGLPSYLSGLQTIVPPLLSLVIFVTISIYKKEPLKQPVGGLNAY